MGNQLLGFPMAMETHKITHSGEKKKWDKYGLICG